MKGDALIEPFRSMYVFGKLLYNRLRVQLQTDSSPGFDAKPVVDGGGPKGENVSLSRSTVTIVGRLELEAYSNTVGGEGGGRSTPFSPQRGDQSYV